MDKSKRLNDIIEAGPCRKGMEEKVIAFASSEMDDSEEKINTLDHILTCDSCLYLFEDSLDIRRNYEDDENYTETWLPLIEFRITGGNILPADNSPSVHSTAAILSQKGEGTAEFIVRQGSVETVIKAVRSKDGADLDIQTKVKEGKLYLINSSGYKTAFDYKGIIRFENVTPGRYALSPDLKQYIFINMTE